MSVWRARGAQLKSMKLRGVKPGHGVPPLPAPPQRKTSNAGRIVVDLSLFGQLYPALRDIIAL